MLLLGNFVHPQVILQHLIDEHFLTYNYRIQLELLAIITAILIKYRQHTYENLPGIYQHLLPMLLSNRRELRHGAMECFAVLCTHMNSYKPITIGTMESNSSIQLLLSNIEQLSYDASHAFRFRLLRNVLPTLTDVGNVTPGLSCGSNPSDDPDVRFILSATTNPLSTPQSTQSSVEPSPIPPKLPATNNKLLLFAMPLVTKKTGEDEDAAAVSSYQFLLRQIKCQISLKVKREENFVLYCSQANESAVIQLRLFLRVKDGARTYASASTHTHTRRRTRGIDLEENDIISREECLIEREYERLSFFLFSFFNFFYAHITYLFSFKTSKNSHNRHHQQRRSRRRSRERREREKELQRMEVSEERERERDANCYNRRSLDVKYTRNDD